MADDKKIGGDFLIDKEKIKRKVEQYLADNIISKSIDKRFAVFLLNNSKNSFDTARVILSVQTDAKLKEQLNAIDFNGLLWVINASYYSIFYMARALLESRGIKLKTNLGVHSVTFDTFVYYFYLSGKLEKALIDDFAEANAEAAEILGKEKAEMLVRDYYYEKDKRSTFTYEMGATALLNKAQTSLNRAKRFNEEIKKLL